MTEQLFHFFNIDPWSALHWMIAISLTLFIFDIFLQTEVISWISVLLFSVYFTLYIDATVDLPTQWMVLLFIVTLSFVIILYYTLWVKIVRPFCDSSFMRKAIPERDERAVNQVVRFRVIEEKEFVEFEDALCDAVVADADVLIYDGDIVRIIAIHDGIFIVQLVSRKK